MKATVNGELREVPNGSTVGGLLELLGVARGGIAVAQNDSVVLRAQLDSQPIADGDRIEIIRAAAGG
jgi:sulfur carrier protein